MVFVGGKDYSEIESRLWLFAILGTALSMLQLLVYSVLARPGTRSIYPVWAALVALVAGGLTNVNTLCELLQLVLAVHGGLAAVLFSVCLLNIRRTPPPT